MKLQCSGIQSNALDGTGYLRAERNEIRKSTELNMNGESVSQNGVSVPLARLTALTALTTPTAPLANSSTHTSLTATNSPINAGTLKEEFTPN